MRLLRLVPILGLFLADAAFAKDKQKITIEVVNSETSQRPYTYTTPGRKGTSETNCNTNGTTNGTVADYGVGPTQINANSNANTNCTTTTTAATPPQTHVGSITQEHVSAILPDGRQVTLWCQEGFRHCDNLLPGKYEAEIDGNALFVFVHDLSGKEHKIKYKAVGVQEASAAQPSQQVSAPPASPSPAPAAATVGVSALPSPQNIDNPNKQDATDEAETQFHLGTLYESGKGVPQDYTQAILWYRKAADQNLAIAQYRLGVLYANGVGVPLDKAQAAAWFRKAADQGYVYAQVMLGSDYLTGEGVQRDYSEAYFWFDVACASKTREVVGGERATMRDTAGAYLSPDDLSRVQERVRKWFEDHTTGPHRP
ncbi:MAG: tetratricopeptide repeat protein [Terracidiphilus sp.]|jgi:hypothetical protein